MQICMSAQDLSAPPCRRAAVAQVLAGLFFCAHHALIWYLRADAEAA